jgi:hypothetical protein
MAGMPAIICLSGVYRRKWAINDEQKVGNTKGGAAKGILPNRRDGYRIGTTGRSMKLDALVTR